MEQAASCSMDVNPSLYLFEDFKVPFRFSIAISIYFKPNFLSILFQDVSFSLGTLKFLFEY